MLRISLTFSPSGGEALVWAADIASSINRRDGSARSDDLHPGRSGRNHPGALALMADADIPPERVEEVLELVELRRAAERRAGTYSLGMRQRLALAGALLGDPEVRVLDEPANGLDPAGVHWLRTFLRRFAEIGGTVLISSHVLAEVASLPTGR